MINILSATTVIGEIDVQIESTLDLNTSTINLASFSLAREGDTPVSLSVKSGTFDTADPRLVTLTLLWDTRSLIPDMNGVYELRCQGIQDTNSPAYTLPDIIVETYNVNLPGGIVGEFAADFSQDAAQITSLPEGWILTGFTAEYYPDWAGENLHLTSSATAGAYTNQLTSAATRLSASAPLEIQFFNENHGIHIGLGQRGQESTWKDSGATSLWVDTQNQRIMSGDSEVATHTVIGGGSFTTIRYSVVNTDDLLIEIFDNDNAGALVGSHTLAGGANTLDTPFMGLAVVSANNSMQLIRTTTA